MQKIVSVREAEVSGKRVLLRADFNVPMVAGQIADARRIKAVVPTIELLLKRGATSVIILTHWGRPEGRVVDLLRVAPLQEKLNEYIPAPNVTIYENLRFDPREEKNDISYAKELAKFGDVYVNDAFANSHREHTSIVLLPTLMPSYAGLLMEREIEELSRAATPPTGSIAIVAGSKFETKIPLLTTLLKNYDKILLGGALAHDVLKSRGLPIGGSLVSESPVPVEIAGDQKVVVPTDAIALHDETKAARQCFINDVRAKEKVVDIGSATAAAWAALIAEAPFVLWNGTLGIYEDGFTSGTDAIAKSIVDSRVRAVVGGGDTGVAVEKQSFDPQKVFISTGGGATLEFLAKGTLPGIEALDNALKKQQ